MGDNEQSEGGKLTRREVDRALHRLDRFAGLMDDDFEIPIIRQKIGLDPLIGLLPGGGDWVTWAAGLYVFWEGLRLGAPRSLLLRMAWNLTVDLLLGVIPIAGDAFDIWFRAHRRNVTLLFDHFGADRHRIGDADLPDSHSPRSTLSRWAIGLAAIFVLTMLAATPFIILWWLVA